MSSPHPYTIVVGIDYSGLADRALDQALEMGTLREGSEIHVLYVESELWAGAAIGVVPVHEMNLDQALLKVQVRATDRLAAMPAHLEKRRIRRVVAHFRRGSPAENIAQLAADLDADLVVVGSHGHRGLSRLLLGSVAERTSHLARCPVWIVRPKDHSAADRVPEIEPPCPECVETRQRTGGESFWCPRHSEHHIRAHAYSYVSDGVYSPESGAYSSTPTG